MEETDLATDLCLLSIDKIIGLRTRMAEAVAALEDGRTNDALNLLRSTLVETDVGTMKVSKPSEEPF